MARFSSPWRREKIAWQHQVDELFVQMGELLTMRAHCDRPEQDPLYQSLQPIADCGDRFRTAKQSAAKTTTHGRATSSVLPEDFAG